jgi:DNA-binding LytR/AlgR family response regulator
MKTIRIGLIDDEENTLQMLNAMISKIPGYEVSFATTSGMEGLDKSQSFFADLIITDILMPEVNGIWLAARLKEINIPVIVISANWSQGWMGYEVEALDFICKPISFTRLSATLEKFAKSFREEIPVASIEKHIYIKDPATNSILLILKNTIAFIKGAKDLAEIHYNDQVDKPATRKQYAKATLSSLLSTLGKDFVQVHKSFVINSTKIAKYEYDHITLDSGFKVPIGETYKSELYRTFTGKILG